MRTDVLDRFLSSVGEVILASTQLRVAAATDGAGGGPRFSGGLDRMDRVIGELQRRALDLRTAPLLRVVEQLPRVAREVAMRGGKRVEVELRGAELELDRAILDRLGDPLVHLIRNAVDHGIETPERRLAAGKREAGRIVIEARREKDTIRIDVADDGAGIDLEAVRRKAVDAGLLSHEVAEDLPPGEIAMLIFRPGLSTAREVSEVSGRGVGMDAVKTTIESLGGAVELRTEPGAGTRTTLAVPISAAVQRVLLLGVGGETVALPIAKIERLLELDPDAVERSGPECFALVDDEPVLVLDVAERLGLASRASAASVLLAIAEVRGERIALRVDRLEGQQEIYVKPVPALLAGLRALSGLTVLGDGRPVFLLDANQIA